MQADSPEEAHQKPETVAQGDGLLFGDWQSKAELQILLEGLEPGQFFSVIEGEYDKGMHRYRAVVQPFADQRYDMWATYWGLNEEEFYKTELMLFHKGFQRQHLQIYQDETKRPFYQMVYVHSPDSPLRGDGVIEESVALLPESQPESSPQQFQPAAPVSTTPESPPNLTADSRNSSPPPPPKAEMKKQSSVAAIYTVVAGNTLSGISKKYKVSVDALKTENKLHGHMLRVGQKLKIPAK